MVGAVIVVLVLAVIVAVVAWLSFTRTVDELEEEHARLDDDATPTVDYEVPEGVDPAFLRGTLRTAGFTSVMQETPLHEVLRISCPPDEREHVREVIEHAPVDLDHSVELCQAYGHVRFADESHAA